MSTAQDKIMAAINTGLGLVSDIQAGLEEVDQAKAVEDQLRSEDSTQQLAQDLSDKVQTITEAEDSKMATAVSKAQVTLDRANKTFTDFETKAKRTRDKFIDDGIASLEQQLGKARQERDVTLAAARSGVHTSQQKVAAVQVSLDKLCQQVKDQHGVDLKSMLQAVRE